MSKVLYDSENRITRGYGNGHNGVDLGWNSSKYNSDQNYNVFANCKGEVVEIQTGIPNSPGATGTRSWGNYVLIKHPNGMHSRYAHLKEVQVSKGQTVDENTIIGIMGNTGNSNGTHLHFEVATGYSSTTRIDPTPYLTKPIYEEPTEKPSTPQDFKYSVGDKVVFNGVLYVNAKGEGAGQSRSNFVCTITKRAEGSRPYNIDNGLGWVAEEDLQPYTNSVQLKVGDKVKIIGTGNGASDGSSNTAYGIGWKREILKIYEGREYPYQVGNSAGTTGFYKASSLEKL